MAVRQGFHRRAALAACLSGSLVVASGLPALGQGGDLCGLLSADDLAAAIPGTYSTPSGFEGTCQWDGTSDAGSDVLVLVYSAPGSASGMPGAEAIDIGGRAAFTMTDPSMTVPTQAVGVESATGSLLLLTVGTDDPGVDVAAAAQALATTAVERFESGESVAVATSVPGASAPASTDGTGGTGAAGSELCTLATPEELAAAAGIDVSLTLSELEGTCSYQALTDTGFVLIYVAQQDPVAFDASVEFLGAEEIDGPGDTDWWSSSMASLFSRSGDRVLQVSYAANPVPSDEEMQAAAIAIMTALLAP